MDVIKKDSEKSLILNKNNIMIKAKYNLNTIETKLYLNILYNLQKYLINTKFDINGCDDVSISIDRLDFKDLVPGIQYLEPAKFIKLFGGLRSKNIYYKIKSKWEVFGFIEKASYNSKTDTVVIKMDRYIAEMLINYKEVGYTPLNLALMVGLEGMYSYRLYELIRLWSNTKEVINYSVEEIKEYLMLEEKKSYNKYNNFKTKVILPAVEELNKLKIFEIVIKENKVGKRVDSIDFYVKDLDTRKYFDKKELNSSKENIDNEKNGKFDTVEVLEYEKSINVQCEDIKTLKIENEKFYIPDREVFAKGTLRIFEKDFRHIDFRNRYMELAFEDSVTITLDKDDVDIIKAASYKFFKGTLENKIEYYKEEEKKDLKDKIETTMLWHE
ncbi:putative replication initiator protein,replication protein,Protein involved in initiation of plasmid replication,Initiator Replication protein [[Clostridium] sordellii]|uniref:replication initiation protein n=1 Tax=Paraclostridium sordellii TaxID=1505 RepID=UPI0005429DD4|nr:replication initiation protein [Paeniclostridium sordellii]CEK34321.1 putative replication initiator protein,replication protein,Protein involved in initiation of plasmid replication,Initiator Replication protein [[Clostridium] sordellii] [Paeniclostridium sordellii]